jgi:TM2 domain-containing membrane protein YozV
MGQPQYPDPYNPGPHSPGPQYPVSGGGPGPGYPVSDGTGPGYPVPGYPAPGYPPAGYPGAGHPAYDPATGLPWSDKSKIAAGLLQIFLGGFGVGRFYTGHTQTAVLQLVVTLFTCGLGSIWGLIDGILILVNGGTDAQGRVLRP